MTVVANAGYIFPYRPQLIGMTGWCGAHSFDDGTLHGAFDFNPTAIEGHPGETSVENALFSWAQFEGITVKRRAWISYSVAMTAQVTSGSGASSYLISQLVDGAEKLSQQGSSPYGSSERAHASIPARSFIAPAGAELKMRAIGTNASIWTSDDLAPYMSVQGVAV